MTSYLFHVPSCLRKMSEYSLRFKVFMVFLVAIVFVASYMKYILSTCRSSCVFVMIESIRKYLLVSFMSLMNAIYMVQ